MTIPEFYEAISGNYKEAVQRLMKDSLIQRFVQKFTADPSYDNLKTALEDGDTENAFRHAHTLKGVSANLAFTGLTEVSGEITEMLRTEDIEAAKAYFPTVSAEYEKVISAIGQLG